MKHEIGGVQCEDWDSASRCPPQPQHQCSIQRRFNIDAEFAEMRQRALLLHTDNASVKASASIRNRAPRPGTCPGMMTLRCQRRGPEEGLGKWIWPAARFLPYSLPSFLLLSLLFTGLKLGSRKQFLIQQHYQLGSMGKSFTSLCSVALPIR